MPIRYNEDFKKEVVRTYMSGNKSTVEIAAEINIAKSSVSDWAKKYSDECNIPHQNQTKTCQQKKFVG